MYRLLTPVLAVIVAITVFTTFVRPMFADYQRIDAEVADYDQALEKAQALQDLINELIADKNSIAQSDEERLMTFLPDQQDNVSVILSLDDAAKRNRMLVEGISMKNTKSEIDFDVTETAKGEVSENGIFDSSIDTDLGTTLSGSKSFSSITVNELYSTVELSFTATGKYEDFKLFLRDLETSLVLMDISQLALSERNEDDLTNFTMTATLYNFVNPLTQ